MDGDLHVGNAVAADTGPELVTLAGRRVPVVSVADGEAGMLDNIGSALGVRQEVCAARRFSKCDRPDQVYGYQEIDADAVMKACGKVLSETAMENVVVSRRALLEAGDGAAPAVGEWQELWDGEGA